MKVRSLIVALVLISGMALAQAPAKSGPQLEAVLNAMDKTAASFKTAEAQFDWDQYTKVVDSHDSQKGTIYFRRAGKGLQMAANITDPAKKYVLYADEKVQVYDVGIDQVTQYAAGKNKADIESFLVLGFGGRGHDLQKSFDVSYGGKETVDGVAAEKLELVPKTAKGRNIFDHITLWIDPARGVSVQQKFLESSGDYRLAKYSNIKLNEKISDDTFKLKTTGKTRYINPQG